MESFQEQGTQILRCLMRIEDQQEKSVKAHNDCARRQNRVAKDVAGLVSFLKHLIMSLVFLDFCTSLLQNQTLSDVVSWMVRNHNFVLPVREEPREDKIHNVVNLTMLPGDAPSSYGRNVARVLWTRPELINGIISPGKDMTFMDSPRIPMTPTWKMLFRGAHQKN